MGAFYDFVRRTNPILYYRMGEGGTNTFVDQIGAFDQAGTGTSTGSQSGLLVGDSHDSTLWAGGEIIIPNTSVQDVLTTTPEYCMTAVFQVSSHLTLGTTDRQFLMSISGDAGPQLYRYNDGIGHGVWNYNNTIDETSSWTRQIAGSQAQIVLNSPNIVTVGLEGRPGDTTYGAFKNMYQYHNGMFVDISVVNNFKNMQYDYWSKSETSFCGNPWGNNNFTGYGAEFILHDRMLSFEEIMIMHRLIDTTGIKSLSGNITESTPVTLWNIRADLLSTGKCAAKTQVSGTSYTLEVPPEFEDEPMSITCLPEQGEPWVAATAYAIDDLVYPTEPDITSIFYKCTTAGTSHASTEPTWPGTGTVGDGTVVWTYQNSLIQPITHSPVFPS